MELFLSFYTIHNYYQSKYLLLKKKCFYIFKYKKFCFTKHKFILNVLGSSKHSETQDELSDFRYNPGKHL